MKKLLAIIVLSLLVSNPSWGVSCDGWDSDTGSWVWGDCDSQINEKTFSDHSSEFVVECIEGFMEILKTPENAIIAISKYKLQSPDAIRTKGYGALSYECGCGESHDVNDINTKKYAAAPIIRLILFCPNKFFTMINIKGFFKQKCISEWACTKKVFDSAIYKLFPEWKKGDKEINNLTLFYKTGKL